MFPQCGKTYKPRFVAEGVGGAAVGGELAIKNEELRIGGWNSPRVGAPGYSGDESGVEPPHSKWNSPPAVQGWPTKSNSGTWRTTPWAWQAWRETDRAERSTGVEADFAARGIGRGHQLADGVEDDAEMGVVVLF